MTRLIVLVVFAVSLIGFYCLGFPLAFVIGMAVAYAVASMMGRRYWSKQNMDAIVRESSKKVVRGTRFEKYWKEKFGKM